MFDSWRKGCSAEEIAGYDAYNAAAVDETLPDGREVRTFPDGVQMITTPPPPGYVPPPWAVGLGTGADASAETREDWG